MRSMAWPLVAAVACRGEAPTVETQEEPSVEPSEWVYESDEDATLDFDGDAVADTLMRMMEEAWRYNAVDVIDQYHANLRLADTACPTWFEYEGQSYWFANCETQTGAEFDGYLFSYVYEQEDIYGNGDIWDMDQLFGYATIIDPQDRWLHIGGATTYGEMTRDDGFTAAYSYLQGGFLTEGGHDPLFVDGTSLNFGLYSGTYTQYPHVRLLQLTGQLSGFGEPGEAIDTVGLTAANGYECPQEFMGSVDVRDARGNWWSVVFDGSAETWAIDPDLCDGCGTAYRGDEAVGEVCVDAESMLNWAGTPW